MIEGCNTHLTFIEITEVRNMENLKLCVCVGGGGGANIGKTIPGAVMKMVA